MSTAVSFLMFLPMNCT